MFTFNKPIDCFGKYAKELWPAYIVKKSDGDRRMKQKGNEPTVKEVLDVETGHIIPAATILAQSQSENHIQRMKDELALLENGQTKYKCPICWEKLLIRGGVRQTYHFKHPIDPDAKCPYRSNQQMTADQILARKYDGAKESFDHRQLKSMIVESLQYDAAVDQLSIQLEKRITLGNPDQDWTAWRQPDVQANRKGQHFVFEVQLATTFLSVVAGRRVFYSKNGSALLWIFREDLVENMPFTYLDIYCNNNFNLFYVSAYTVENSKRMGEMRLMCRYEAVRREGERIQTFMQEVEVGISELRIDVKRQLVYFYDRQEELDRINNEIRQDYIENETKLLETSLERYYRLQRERKEAIYDRARSHIKNSTVQVAFFNAWCEVAQDDHSDENYRYVWEYFQPFFDREITGINSEFTLERKAIISALFSLRESRVIGSKLQNLKGLENLVFNSYKQFYGLFIRAVKIYKRESEIQIRAPESTAYKHYAIYRDNREQPQFKQDLSLEQLVQYLFSE
jgi:competence CoiA-like predicted nuclease